MEFRPLRRKKNAISEEAAKSLLEQERRGVLAVNGDDDYPYALPINYYYDREAGKIYFHGARKGYKVDALKNCDKVCFTVFGNEHYQEGDWAPYMQSTIVFGRCRLLETNQENIEKLRTFAMKYYPSKEEVEEEIAQDAHAAQIFEITIEHLCGKQVQEK